MKKLIHLFAAVIFLTINSANAQFVEAQQCIGGSGSDIIADVQKTSDSGLIVLVNTTSNDGDFDDNTGRYANALIKLNSHYEIEWKKTYSDTNLIYYTILQQHDNEYYLSYFGVDPDTLSAPFYYHLARVGIDGSEIWNKTYTTNAFSYTSLLLLFRGISFLKNNTIAFATIKDTTLIVHNLDKAGNIIWDLLYNYDTLLTENYSGWGFGYAWMDNRIVELNDNTILLVNTMSNFCFFFCPNDFHKTHFINIDYNGAVIKERLADTAMSINDLFYKEDADDIYFTDGYAGFTKIHKTDFSFNKRYLNLGQIISINNYYYYYLLIQDKQPLFLYTEYDSSNSVTNIFLQRYDLLNDSILYKTLLDTSAVAYYYPNMTAYILPDNGYIIIYAKNGVYNIARIDNAGNIIYNKVLSASIKMNENIASYYGFYPYGNYAYINLKNYQIKDNKLYSYNFWQYTDTAYNYHYTQKFFIHDIETGNIEYEYNNDIKDSLVYKYIAPYPDKKNELFVLSDLNGNNTCKLGGFDILMSKVISATNKIHGKAFIDYNNNNVKDSGEPAYGLAYLESSKNNNTLSTYMYGSNFTINYVDTGIWITKLVPHHTYYDVQPASFTSTHPTFGNSDTVIFAMHPLRIVNDLKISLVNSFVTRLGSTTNYEIAYANEGTHTANGTIKLVVDSRLHFNTSNPAILFQNGDTLIWDFANLLVNETRKIIVQSGVPTPPTLNVGDSLHSVVFIEPTINDSTPNDNHAVLNEVIRGSYDPNDKTSTSGDNLTPAQIQQGDYITYVVRFQNTGNDTAFRIVIEDTLDANLDWSTLQPLNTDYPFSMQVVNKNIIQFTFSNLKLPPASINEPESHGFIAYKVKPKSDVAQGITIKNIAHIYFDFNVPVKTNTVNTHIALLSAVKNNHLQQNGKISVYPNPNNGIFNLEFNANYTSPLNISIYDVTGKLVYQNSVQHRQKSILSVNTENLASGIYSILLKTDNEQLSDKIIIDK